MLHLHAALEARFETPPPAAGGCESVCPLRHYPRLAPDGADGLSTSRLPDGKPIVRERVRWP